MGIVLLSTYLAACYLGGGYLLFRIVQTRIGTSDAVHRTGEPMHSPR